ncbi:MAG: prepilin-type N-terminal cleavage/methylation domain-containing protein [Lentisphaerae bacterium]|nr:prepilin-type N-terminal cleavage/methylation domain-containing protein [Lentisphaerota bacterium]
MADLPRVRQAFLPVIRCVGGHHVNCCGFTLMEALVGLLVMAVALTAALEAHLSSIRMEQAARSLPAVRYALDGWAAETMLGLESVPAPQDGAEEFLFRTTVVPALHSGADTAITRPFAWQVLEVTARDRASFSFAAAVRRYGP